MDKREEPSKKEDTNKYINNIKTRGGKIKSKIKKLCSPKRKQEDPISESDEEAPAYDKTLKTLIKNEIKAKIKKLIPRKLMKSSFWSTKQALVYKRDVGEAAAIEDQVVQVNEDVAGSNSGVEIIEKKGRFVFETKEITWDMGRTSFVVLIQVILVGLIFGRFWAIVLTLIWCSGGTLARISSKFLQSFVGNLS